MPAVDEKGSPAATTERLQLLLNYCRTVVRPDDHLLRSAIGQYEQFLATQQRR